MDGEEEAQKPNGGTDGWLGGPALPTPSTQATCLGQAVEVLWEQPNLPGPRSHLAPPLLSPSPWPLHPPFLTKSGRSLHMGLSPADPMQAHLPGQPAGTQAPPWCIGPAPDVGLDSSQGPVDIRALLSLLSPH